MLACIANDDAEKYLATVDKLFANRISSCTHRVP
jgi:hypothetical protein